MQPSAGLFVWVLESAVGALISVSGDACLEWVLSIVMKITLEARVIMALLLAACLFSLVFPFYTLLLHFILINIITVLFYHYFLSVTCSRLTTNCTLNEDIQQYTTNVQSVPVGHAISGSF